MNTDTSHSSHRIFSILPYTLLYLASLYLSYLQPMNYEDYWHMAAEGLSEGFPYAQQSFMTWNSRLGELLSYFIGQHADLIDIICTPLSVVLIAYLLCRWAYFLTDESIISNRLQTSYLSCLMTGSLCVFFHWYLSNLNWFIPCALVLLTLWCMRHYFHTQKLKLLVFTPLFVLLGWSNEVLAVILIILFCLCTFYQSYQSKKIPSKFFFALLIALLIGLYLSVYGSLARQSTVGFNVTLWDRIMLIFSKSDIFYFGICFFKSFTILLMLLFLAGYRYVRYNFFTKTNILLISLFALSLLSLSQAPYWGAPRSYQPLYLICFLIILIESIKSDNYYTATKRCLLFSLVLFFMITPWISAYASAWTASKERERICSAIQQQKALGIKHVILEPHIIQNNTFSLTFASIRLPHIIFPQVKGSETLSAFFILGDTCKKTQDRLPNQEFAKEQGVLSVSVKNHSGK